MLEIFINSIFKMETEALKRRLKNFCYFQVASSEEFEKVHEERLIKFENNENNKKFKIIAN